MTNITLFGNMDIMSHCSAHEHFKLISPILSMTSFSFKALTHPGDIFGAASLVVVNVDALQLEVRLAGVGARGVDSVLIARKSEHFRTQMKDMESFTVVAMA